MKTTVTKVFTFDAAHLLVNYHGPCANMHGHTYKLEVTLYSEKGILNQGMLMDFTDVKKVVSDIILDKVDHKILNEVLPCPTTAECMAEYFFTRLDNYLSDTNLQGIRVDKIRLWETPTSYAEVIR